MFRDLSLSEAFERVAGQDEWLEFCHLKPEGDLDVWMWVFGMGDASRSPSPQEQAILRYRDLWSKFAGLIHGKLLAGEWVADGFNPQYGAHPIQINTRHWRVLEFALGHDRVEGGGYQFVNLSFSEVRSVSSANTHAERASLESALIRWIEALGATATGPMLIADARDMARREFSGTKISNHLFEKAWGIAKKPEHFRQRGRPKTKVAGL